MLVMRLLCVPELSLSLFIMLCDQNLMFLCLFVYSKRGLSLMRSSWPSFSIGARKALKIGFLLAKFANTCGKGLPHTPGRGTRAPKPCTFLDEIKDPQLMLGHQW